VSSAAQTLLDRQATAESVNATGQAAAAITAEAQPISDDPVIKRWLEGQPAAPVGIEPLDLMLDRDPVPPTYVVHGLISEKTVNVLSSDTGGGKTWCAHALVLAVCESKSWLGRTVTAERASYVDEENPAHIPRSRLRALGLSTVGAAERLRYFSRKGIRLGDPEWHDWLSQHLRDFRPALVIVDTAMAATSVLDVNDNSAVVELFKGLRQLAEEHNAAFLILHHERKSTGGQGGGQSAMGARSWITQADSHLTLRLESCTEDPSDEDWRVLRTTTVLRTPKLRDDIEIRPEVVVIESLKNAAGATIEATVTSEGPAAAAPPRDHEMVELILECLADGPLGRGELAKAAGVDAQNGTFTRALKAATAAERVVQPKPRGPYELPVIGMPAI
jgi:hypothetical protein